MKKILIILFLFLFSNTSYANDAKIDEFNNWLFDNGHTQYFNIEQKAGCKKLIQKYGLKEPKVGLFDEPKVKTNEWFWLECHKFQGTNNLKIKFYKYNEIPEFSKPNKDTALYYLYRGQEVVKASDRAGSTKSDNPYKFKFTVILGAKIIEHPTKPKAIPIILKKCILFILKRNEIIATNMGSKLATITAR